MKNNSTPSFILFISFFLLLNSIRLSGQQLDQGFDGDGVVINNAGATFRPASFQTAAGMHEVGSGKLLLVSAIERTHVVVSRRQSNGLLDSTFGLNGYSLILRMWQPVSAMQPDGKIVVAGGEFTGAAYNIKIVRFQNNGQPDSTFGVNGILVMDIFGGDDIIRSVKIQPDKKIVVGGRTVIAGRNAAILLRLNTNGTVDTSFGENGISVTEPVTAQSSFAGSEIADFSIQPDGKLLAAGQFIDPPGQSAVNGYFIARYLVNGSLDTSFGSGGWLLSNHNLIDDNAVNINLLTDGRFIVGINTASSAYLARYQANGQADTTIQVINAQGVILMTKVELTPANEIIVGGWNRTQNGLSGQVTFRSELMTLNMNGTVINRFTNSSSQLTNFVRLQSGQVISAIMKAFSPPVFLENDYTLFRHQATLVVDPSYGISGSSVENYIAGYKTYTDAMVLKDGRLLPTFTRSIPSFCTFVELMNRQGQLVNSFGQIPICYDPQNLSRSMLVKSMGFQFLVGRNNTIERMSLSQEPDRNFGTNGKVQLTSSVPIHSIMQMAVSPDNKIVAVAVENNRPIVFRLNSNGTYDQGFGTGGILEINGTDNVFGRLLSYDNLQIVIQPDGKIILAFTAGTFTSTAFFMRIDTNGTIDRSFGTNGSFAIGRLDAPRLIAGIHDLFMEADGNLIVGVFVTPDLSVEATRHVYRVLSNGTLDSSFDIILSQHKISLQPYNGKIIVGGSVINTAGNREFLIQQFHTNGVADSSFGNNGNIHLDVSPGNDFLQKLVVDRNRLYALGYSEDFARDGVVVRYLLDTTSAEVTITNPFTGSVFAAGSPITVQTTVSTVAGGWSKVEFLHAGVVIGTDNSAPYELHATGVEPGNYPVTARGITNSGDTVESYAVNITVTSCSGAGSITAEGYLDIPGGAIFDLMFQPKFPDNPDIRVALNNFEFAQTQLDSFGARVRGYICAPATGLYTFNVAANNQGELWLSTDDNPANRRLIATVYISVPFRGWNNFSTQKSAPVYLVKGVRYYIEALQKDDGGDDHLSVAWTLPNGQFEGPIPGHRLIPFPVDSTDQIFVSNRFMPPAKEMDQLQVTVSPNPSTHAFLLTFKSNREEIVNITVTDVLGRVVERVSNRKADLNLMIGSRLKAGVYFVEVRQGMVRKRVSVVKQ